MDKNKLIIKRFGRLFYYKGITALGVPIDTYLPIEDVKLRIYFDTTGLIARPILYVYINGDEGDRFEIFSYPDIVINNIEIQDREMLETQLSIVYPNINNE